MAGGYAEAVEAYGELVGDSSVGLRATCGRAWCLLETGRYAEAAEGLESVGARGKADALWLRTSADVAFTLGRYDEAIEHLKSAVETGGADVQSLQKLGEAFEYVGRREAAVAVYARIDKRVGRGLPERADELASAAVGFLRYSALTRHAQLTERTRYALQDMLQRAYQTVDRGYWPARVMAGEILRSKFRGDDAAKDFEAALRINPNLAAAQLGLARVALDRWNFERVEKHLALAREANPNSPEAHRVEAALRLIERRYVPATESAARALAINGRDIEALGYAAAAAYCVNDSAVVEAYRKRAEKVSACPSAFHRIMGDTLGGLRQYAESESAYQRAIKCDPTDPHTHAELGLMYMQWGEEAKAEAALAAAWELDEFDARTLNTLNLLREIATLETLETAHFVIKFREETDAVLAPYLAEYLEGIHAELSEDFAWDPKQKTIIELLPTHRMFGVRITGKPWIHTVGACTGRVIALESPRVDVATQGRYNIARVLRHEFTHTVTLGATGNRIPHWLTEGLAVMQEDTPRSWVWRLLLVDALRREELFTLASIDWGFMRPRKPTDRSMAYAQSEWMCQFIVDRFGYASVDRMLAGYAERLSQPQVLKKVLGLTREAFDSAFVEWAREDALAWGLDLTPVEDVAALASTIDESVADAVARLAKAHLDAGDLPSALASASRAVELDDGSVLAARVLTEVLWALRESAEDDASRDRVDERLAVAADRLLKLDESKWIASKALGTIALRRQRFDEAGTHFERSKRLLPLDPSSDKSLAGVRLSQGQSDRAIESLRALAAVEEDDPEIPAYLARFLVVDGRLAEGRYWYKQAIYIDAFNAGLHRCLADVCVKFDDHACAAMEYRALSVLEPDVLSHLENAARSYLAAGDTVRAREFARRAIAKNPESIVADLAREAEQ